MTLSRLLPALALTLLGACAQNAADMTAPRVAPAARGATDRADVSLSMTPTDHLVTAEGTAQVVATKPTDDEVSVVDRERASHVTREHVRPEIEHAPRMDHSRPHRGR